MTDSTTTVPPLAVLLQRSEPIIYFDSEIGRMVVWPFSKILSGNVYRISPNREEPPSDSFREDFRSLKRYVEEVGIEEARKFWQMSRIDRVGVTIQGYRFAVTLPDETDNDDKTSELARRLQWISNDNEVCMGRLGEMITGFNVKLHYLGSEE